MTTIGFIGLGVMGGPMCRNIALKHDGDVVAFDLVSEASEALKDTKAKFVSQIEDIWATADVAFLSLPGGAQVEFRLYRTPGDPGSVAKAEDRR